jgi:hypothetical protein
LKKLSKLEAMPIAHNLGDEFMKQQIHVIYLPQGFFKLSHISSRLKIQNLSLEPITRYEKYTFSVPDWLIGHDFHNGLSSGIFLLRHVGRYALSKSGRRRQNASHPQQLEQRQN